jgi:hypothetical protein
MDNQRALMAAHNNAEWCDVVCRTHGVETRFDRDVWVALHRSPPLYPDAVTLTEEVLTGRMLRRVDTSSGCSIKDSLAALDLSPHGFRVLFEAEWIHRRPPDRPVPDSLTWHRVRTPDELRAWGAAHGGGAVFRPALLHDPAVAIVVACDGDAVAAGAIGHRGTAAIGVSNLFANTAPIDQVWMGAVAAICTQFPDLPLVGYETGVHLLAARRAGFVSVGPLRVWLKD